MSLNFNNLLAIVGQFFFIFLIYLAHTFYLERLINIDCAYYTMQLVFTKTYFFPLERYINFIPQTLPLMAVWANLSLENIIWVYSMSYMLIYWLCFNWVSYGLKNKVGGFLLVLVLCLGFRYHIYVAVAESTFTFFILAVFIAWWTSLKRQQSKWYKWLITTVLTALIAIGHPIILIPFLIFVGFDTIFHKKYFDLEQLKMVTIGLGCFALRYLIVPQNGYDKAKISLLKKIFSIKIWEFPIVDLIKSHLIWELGLPILVFIFFAFYWIKKGKTQSIVFLVFSALVFLLLIAVTLSTEYHRIFNIVDCYLGIWSIIIALPIYYFLLQKNNAKTAAVASCLVLVVFGGFKIWEKHTFFENRLAIMQQLLDKNTVNGQRKIMLKPDLFPHEKLWYTWSIGLETMLLSSVKDPKNSATIYVYEDAKQVADNNKEDVFFCTPWLIHEFYQNSLPPQYFSLPKQTYIEGVW